MVNEATSVSVVLKMDEEREAPSEHDEFEENPVPDLEGSIDPDIDVGAGAPRPSLAVRDLPSDLRLDHEISMLARREPIVAGLEDHFTLPTSSNLVRFRSKQNAARVYNEGNFQTILEEEYDPKTATSTISVKRMEDVTAGVTILRISYSVVCALWTGFFFVFCLQVLLFLVLDLAVESGATNINASVNVGTTIGVVLGIIVFVHAFAEALVIAGHYIADTWGGHSLAKQFIFKNLSNVAVDWVFFFAFLLAPLLVMCSTLLMQLENWWAITAITWFIFVLAFFIIFCVNVVYFEVNSAWLFCKNQCDTDRDNFFPLLKRCVLLRQKHTYSGTRLSAYIARSVFTTTEDTEDATKAQVYEDTRHESFTIWTRITKTWLSPFYKTLDPPRRLYTMDDVQDYRPFLTRNMWSLERVFCRPRRSRYIAIIKGPGSLTRSQFRSSFICSLIGTGLIVLIFISVLVWFHFSGIFVLLAFIVVVIAALGTLRGAYTLYKLHNDLINVRTLKKEGKDNDADEEFVADAEEEFVATEVETKSTRVWKKAGAAPSEGVYLVEDYERVTEADDKLCYAMLGLEFVFLFLYPAIALFMVSWNVAVLFVGVALISATRYYVNAAVIIEETGNMELVGGSTKEKKWVKMSRLNTIVTAVTVARSKNLWLALLGVSGFAFLAIFLGAVGSSTDSTNDQTLTYMPDFYYPPQSDDMRYATCQLSNIRGGFGNNATMADYVFMAGTAYTAVNLTQPSLDAWFGVGVAVDEQGIVDEFRAEFDEFNQAVSFKLFSFPSIKLAVISIRGTTTNWDMLADMQLWSAAALMQGIRAILPVGGIWTPIFAQIVSWINEMQSQSIEKISFYILTTQFANYLKNDTQFENIQVTGHSLGGGLAMITGAQASIPAVGVSGPNALISGRSFKPEVTEEQMNQYTFNIVPNRDIVPMLDDKADQYQYIRCEAEPYDFVGCHFSKRSLCEILYTCGTGNRPAACQCVTDYGYPQPLTDGNRTFDEVCGVST